MELILALLKLSDYAMMVLALVAIVLYPYFKGLTDLEMKYNTDSISDNDTWDDKYKKDINGNFIPRPTTGWYGWYHKTFGLSYHEVKFMYGTWLVSKTDGWHKYDSLRNWCYAFIGSYILYAIFDIYAIAFLLPIRFGVLLLIFHLTYTWKILPGTQEY